MRRLIFALWMLGFTTAVGGQDLPRDLVDLAAQIDCRPVPSFFERRGMVEPPYLYGYLPGRKQDSVVFWCVDRDSMYVLVASSAGEITGQIRRDFFPGGLSLFPSASVDLGSFYYVDDAQGPGPAGVKTSYPPIQDSYDGVTFLYYQHDGRWLFRVTH